MSKLKRTFIGASIAAGSIIGAGALETEPKAVEASNYEQIDQGYYSIPDNCPDYAGRSISIETERKLRKLGFTGIEVNGVINDVEEQEAFRGVQVFMSEIGVLDDSVSDCGYPGSLTMHAAEKMLIPSTLDDESKISHQQTNTKSENSNSTDSCDTIDLTSWAASRISGSDGDRKLDNGAEARALQEALNRKGFNVGRANGLIGSRTLGKFAVFQKETFGEVDCLLGSQSSSELDLNTTKERDMLSDTIINSKHNGIIEGCKAEYDVDYVVCADTGPGTETGYFYKRSSNGNQTLLRKFQITTSQIDTDGPNFDKDTLTRKGHHIMGYATRKTPKLSLRNFLQFNGEQGIHYYPVVGGWADSSGCVRTDLDTSNYLFETLAVNSNAAFTGNVEVIIK